MTEKSKVVIELEHRLARLEAERGIQSHGRRVSPRWLLVGGVLSVLLASSALALTDGELGCTEGSGLFCLRPGVPARATEVNANFSLLLSWLEAKVGSTDADGIAVSGPSALAGNVTVAPAATLTVNGPTVLNGPVTVPTSMFVQSGPYTVSMADRNGSDAKTMTAAARSVCFLSNLSLSEIDVPSEWGGCDVAVSNGNWVVTATLVNTPNANIVCTARCLSW
jgi:hypothetical protein